jgi:hypothetical protein
MTGASSGLDSWSLRTADRLAHGLPEVFESWMSYKVIRDESDRLVVVADKPRSNVQHEPAAWERLHSQLYTPNPEPRQPTVSERREAEAR